MIYSFRQPGDLRLPAEETHGFPPPPHDGFSFFLVILLLSGVRILLSQA